MTGAGAPWRISVALCTYNGARYLGEQLASLCAQTTPPDELVVCDDGSSDDTAAILDRFAREAPFAVRVHVNAERLGSTANFARAVGLCEGELIALCDQDDVWHARKLEALAAPLRADAECGGAFSDARLVDADLRPLGRTLWHEVGFDEPRQAEFAADRAFRVLLRTQVVTGAALMFRASARALLLPIDRHAVHDAWIALLLAATSRLVPVPEPLLDYRQHGANLIGGRRMTLRQRLRAVWRPLPMMSVPSSAELFAAVAERLRTHVALLRRPHELAALEDLLAHLRTRTRLPESRVRRLAPVLREAATGRYGRFSSGLLSAVKDLAR